MKKNNNGGGGGSRRRVDLSNLLSHGLGAGDHDTATGADAATDTSVRHSNPYYPDLTSSELEPCLPSTDELILSQQQQQRQQNGHPPRNHTAGGGPNAGHAAAAAGGGGAAASAAAAAVGYPRGRFPSKEEVIAANAGHLWSVKNNYHNNAAAGPPTSGTTTLAGMKLSQAQLMDEDDEEDNEEENDTDDQCALLDDDDDELNKYPNKQQKKDKLLEQQTNNGNHSSAVGGSHNNYAEQSFLPLDSATNSRISSAGSSSSAGGATPEQSFLFIDPPLPPAAPAVATLGPPKLPQPQVWGRKKTVLPSLEEDTMDANELEFADDTALVQRHKLLYNNNDDYDDNKNTANAISVTVVAAAAASLPGAQSRTTSSSVEDDQFKAAILESQKLQEEAIAARHDKGTRTPRLLLSAQDVEEARENARTLRTLVDSPEVDVDFLNTVLSLCRADHRKVSTVIEDIMLGGDDVDETAMLHSIEKWIDLNGNILDAIEHGEAKLNVKAKYVERRQTRSPSPTPAPASPPSPPQEQLRQPSSNGGDVRRPSQSSSPQQPQDRRRSSVNNKRIDLDVQDLVDKRDIFSLICVLRVHEDEKRADAAMALVRFARGAESGDQECVALREEIRSSGGLHSLLTLFRTAEISHKLRALTALAVAYVLPSYVESESHTSPSLGLKIVECLKFLLNEDRIAHNSEVVNNDEIFDATARALTTFWISHLEPPLQSKSRPTVATAPSLHDLKRCHSWVRPRGRLTDQYGKNAAMHELIDAAVTLIVSIAKRETDNEGDKGSCKWSATLIEQCCALERARAIAVRRGILHILVRWIRSGDREKIRPAASALRYVTSIKDNYMAGWIHSEIVNKGAVNGLVELTHDIHLTHDIRLAITQILSSLCAAPHTRAAVVEAECVNFFIGILYEYDGKTNSDLAFYATSAIVQLTAGAIARSTVLSDFTDTRIADFVSPDERNTLLGEILNSGVLASFVAIVGKSEGKLRSMAIQALQVISDDDIRNSRLQLCEIGAAKSLGKSLKQSLGKIWKVLADKPEQLDHDAELHYRDIINALYAVSNILDPPASQETRPPTSSRSVSSSSIKESQQFLVQGCLDLAGSGGLEAILSIAGLPFDSRATSPNCFLLHEACRTLCFLSPILLTAKVAASGYSKWAHSLWLAFHRTLEKLSKDEMIDFRDSGAADMYLDVLNGLGILARSEPLKVRMIEKTLPHLLKARNMGDQADISNAASQAFQYLDITRDELSAQVVGNSANVGAEWFCMQRSFLLQAMARTEIRQVVCDMWKDVFRSVDHGYTNLIRLSSEVVQAAQRCEHQDLFREFSDDHGTEKMRESLISEYKDIYGAAYSEGELSDIETNQGRNSSLLSSQAYPLTSSDMEAKWILEHGQSCMASELTALSLSSHVARYLNICFPSDLLRDQIIPLQMLKPTESYNFRSIIMAQRKYFSFRREGQLIANLLEKEGHVLGSGKLHCTLNFRNSAFAGEFPESLVQVLYKCPVINGLSFVKDTNFEDLTDDDDDRLGATCSQEGLLMSLVGAFPPWVSHVTFDGVVENTDIDILVQVLNSIGHLSCGRSSIEHDGESGQGILSFLAIRNSPTVSTERWQSFIRLFGDQPDIRGKQGNVLTALVALDLSGNDLGDTLAGSLLNTMLNGDYPSSVQELDLSQNRIQAGVKCLDALRLYKSNLMMNKQKRHTTLYTLRLASNGLRGKSWIEILSLIHDNGLPLKQLDLSGNGIVLHEREFDFANHMVRTLTSKCTLQILDLSHNRISSPIVDHILNQLIDAKGRGAVLLFLKDNHPPLSAGQAQALSEVTELTRKQMLRAYLDDSQQQRDTGSVLNDGGSIPEDRSVTSYSVDNDNFFASTIEESRAVQSNRTDNSITVLFSAPLVFTDGRTLRPFAKLDFDLERELIWQCLKEASRDIELSFDSATHERLLATMAKRCGCLHYSGHGHQHYLPFEDGSGGPYWFKVDQFKSLIEKEGGAPFRFVFVSACYSYLAGETFASAGVPHVVCCQQESELKDTAALAFTRQFYLALAIGHTVRDAFDQGCKAVRATPNLRNPDLEMKKFLLLPENGNHNVPIFDAKPIPEWPKSLNDDVRWRRRSVIQGAKSSELSVRNMMQEDPAPTPPEFFLGREIEMYYTLKAVLGKRLVSVTGDQGVGRSSLACALCHYINERATTILGIERIYYIKARKSRKRTPLQSSVQRLREKLFETENGKPSAETDDDMEAMFESICKKLKQAKVLIVFDRVEHIVDRDDEKEFPMLLSKLLRETKNVKILLTNKDELGIPSLGEHPIGLGPLKFSDTVRLFSSLCPYLHTPIDRRKLFETLVTNKEEAELLSTDPGVGETTKSIFYRLGDGIPSLIEKAAYDLSKEEFLQLYKTA